MFDRRSPASALAAMLIASPAAWALDPQALQTASLAANCATCHGTQGRGPSGFPLAGMPRELMLQRLRDYKKGTLSGTLMNQLARGFSDAQLEQIAAYFAAQKP
jgi:sulfide dehydrogenase cytochrome subunit